MKCLGLHTLSLNQDLHSNDSNWAKYFVSFNPAIKLYTFRIIFFTLLGTQTWAYGSSIALQHSSHLLRLTVNGWKKVSSKFILTSLGLAWHG